MKQIISCPLSDLHKTIKVISNKAAQAISDYIKNEKPISPKEIEDIIYDIAYIEVYINIISKNKENVEKNS